jgi:hypothetical protein
MALHMHEAALRVTGVKVPQLPAPKPSARKAARVLRMQSEGKAAAKLVKPKRRSALTPSSPKGRGR